MGAEITVAKKRKVKSAEKREALIAMRSRVEFKEWLEELAESTHHTPTQILEMGAIAIAKQYGFKDAPKR